MGCFLLPGAAAVIAGGSSQKYYTTSPEQKLAFRQMVWPGTHSVQELHSRRDQTKQGRAFCLGWGCLFSILHTGTNTISIGKKKNKSLSGSQMESNICSYLGSTYEILSNSCSGNWGYSLEGGTSRTQDWSAEGCLPRLPAASI